MPLVKHVHTDADGTVTVDFLDVPVPPPTSEEQLAAAVQELTSKLATATSLAAVRSAAVDAASELLP